MELYVIGSDWDKARRNLQALPRAESLPAAARDRLERLHRRIEEQNPGDEEPGVADDRSPQEESP